MTRENFRQTSPVHVRRSSLGSSSNTPETSLYNKLHEDPKVKAAQYSGVSSLLLFILFQVHSPFIFSYTHSTIGVFFKQVLLHSVMLRIRLSALRRVDLGIAFEPPFREPLRSVFFTRIKMQHRVKFIRNQNERRHLSTCVLFQRHVFFLKNKHFSCTPQIRDIRDGEFRRTKNEIRSS